MLPQPRAFGTLNSANKRVVQAPLVSRRNVSRSVLKTPETSVASGTASAPAASSTPEVKDAILQKLRYLFGKPDASSLSAKDAYHGTSWALREKLIDAFDATQAHWTKADPKFVYYMSAEFLMGRSLSNVVHNLELSDQYGKALNQLGYDLEAVQEQERDASLGNGGLGRLAACFVDAFANLDLPGWGYGIRYKYGMFKQSITDGLQTESPDIWLTEGNPWEVKRDIKHVVGFAGKTEKKTVNGKQVSIWTPGEKVVAQAYDNPIPGFRTPTVTNLRLWDAVPVVEFDLNAFNAGDFISSARDRLSAESISAVLYPNDSTPEGKELRLKQQYFFVAASLADVVSRFKVAHPGDWALFPEKAVFQMNDTHPTIAVAELMRILVDQEGLDWDKAWGITSKCLNYTNHTVMPEALEKWPVKVMAKMLPRHMEIIETINAGWTAWLQRHLKGSDKEEKIAAMQIVHKNQWNEDELLVNMAYLAVVGSSYVNGVAAIHSEIVKDEIFNDFYKIFPEKFQNKTNGVTPRRWLAWCNPELSALITEALGSDDWINETDKLQGLKKFADDKAFQAKWRAVKQAKKAKLADLIKNITGDDDINLNSLFDVQIKRIHEYKRQYLNLLSVIWQYKALKKMSPAERKKAVPRVVIMGGKAASAYDMAKRIVRLANAIGKKINHDPDTKDLLRCYFLPDYNVSLAETMIPGAELSQHISTAGTEASGTSNMKFQMNGCLIIGTWDGANIEIAEEGGVDNTFVFGFRAELLNQLRKDRKNYQPDPRFLELMADIEGGMFGEKEYFKPLVDSVSNMKVGNDWFLVANDFAAYLDAQKDVDRVYADKDEWTRRSIMYTAGSGKFSSDRTIREYAQDIWHIVPCRPPTRS